MIKSYLIIEKGLLDERLFLLGDRVTIGRMPGNDLKLSDSTVSKRHAVVYRQMDHFVVEDVGSQNGTFLNGEPVKKAALSNGDILKLGGVVLRFSQEEEIVQDKADLAETQELTAMDVSDALRSKGTARQSQRIVQALSGNPLFSGLSADELAQVSQLARLVLVNRGRTIIRQGDRGKFLDIILDGKVRVFTYDQKGQEIPLVVLTENQFFGEISLLTGAPRTATVQAIQEALLCRLSFEAMREILSKFPIIKGTLEKYRRERLKDIEDKKKAAGFVERRRHPRYNIKLPVNLSLSPTSPVSNKFKGKVFQCTSLDLSASGIRVAAEDGFLLTLPAGCPIRLEITLGQPYGPIRCLAVLRNILQKKEGEVLGCLGIEFTEMSPDHRAKLKQFLMG